MIDRESRERVCVRANLHYVFTDDPGRLKNRAA